MSATASATLDHKLTQLKLARIRDVYPQWITHAEQQGMGYGEFLDELLAEEEARIRRTVAFRSAMWRLTASLLGVRRTMNPVDTLPLSRPARVRLTRYWRSAKPRKSNPTAPS